MDKDTEMHHRTPAEQKETAPEAFASGAVYFNTLFYRVFSFSG